MKNKCLLRFEFYNEDCIAGCRKHIRDNSVDLIITDPPYGIEGDKLDRHYNRNESHVIDGYVEIPNTDYPDFSLKWITEAERILKPGGSIYIVSGYTNLIHILNALRETNLQEVNHIIWKYNFGVYARAKYVSSHYHILFYKKKGRKHTFNTYSRYADHERSDAGGSSNYLDREDVWQINREYKPGKVKNKNELPTQLLAKMIQYSSNEGDVVCDLFLGSFSTAKVAKGLNRQAVGFELNKTACNDQVQEVDKLREGYLAGELRKPPMNKYVNGGKPVGAEERKNILASYARCVDNGMTKKASIANLSEEFGRGYWSILKVIDGTTNASSLRSDKEQQSRLF